jgi:hypothetical protein
MALFYNDTPPFSTPLNMVTLSKTAVTQFPGRIVERSDTADRGIRVVTSLQARGTQHIKVCADIESFPHIFLDFFPY